MKKDHWKYAGMGLFLFFLTSTFTIGTAWAGPFSSFPGTKAAAMAGAFTAVADDPSAVWYNPAGLAGMGAANRNRSHRKIEVVLGWGQNAGIEAPDGDLENDNAWFLGGDLRYPEYGVGAFYYTPYTINYWASERDERDVAWGKVEEDIQIFSIPAAVSLPVADYRLNIGAALEWIRADIGGTQITYRDASGFANGYEAESDSESGLSGSLGLLFTGGKDLKFSLGATYRFRSGADIGEAAMRLDTDTGVGELFFDRPQSFDIGVAVTSKMGADGAGAAHNELTLSVQYGFTDWGDAGARDIDLDYATYAFGGEYAVVRPNERFNRLAVRAGYTYSDPSGGAEAWDWPEVSAFTYGVGLRMGQFQVDLAQEYATYENDAGLDESRLLTSATVTLVF